jgi:hypothetical protein
LAGDRRNDLPWQVAREAPDPTVTIQAARGAHAHQQVCVTRQGSPNVHIRWFKEDAGQGCSLLERRL